MKDGFKEPSSKFWIVWVDGGGPPHKRCKTLEIAEQDALRLRAEVTRKNVFIFECVEMLEGRHILMAREKRLAESEKQV